MADGIAPSFIDHLRQAVGPDNIRLDEPSRALMSQDIYSKGAMVAAVVAPASTEETAAVVAIAARAGAAVLPRGGGMSYTGGYIHDAPGAVLLDMRRMNRVLEVNADDMYVRVEAGATWAELHAATAAKGLRTPFWGPLSGLSSSIGGGLSQNNAFFGAGHYGPTADSVTGVTVVLADGGVVRTGAGGAQGGAPFFRHFGPDLTGVFLGDCGALGVKTEAALRLITAPEHEGYVSFSFADKQANAKAMTQIAREGLASELFGFDPTLAQLRLKRASLLADAGTLLKVVGAQKSLFDGLKEGAKMALAGRGFIAADEYSLHAVAEGRSKAAVDHDLARMRAIAAACDGKEVENTIPKVIRATPFTPLNNVLGPEGERWAPVHGIVPHSKALDCWSAIDALFDQHQARSEELGVLTGYLVTTLSTNAFLIEPVFYWPEERFALHDETVEPAYLAKMPRHDPNPEATQHVAFLRSAVVDIFTGFGAAHFQVGRAYPLLASRSPDGQSLLRAVKAALDPQGMFNPGALGL